MKATSTLRDLNKIFKTRLQELYDIPEIESIYSITIEYVTGFNKTQQILHIDDSLETEMTVHTEQILQRLCKNEPLQYILGETEFYGMVFNVNKNVLIPRQETEVLVDTIINTYRENAKKILDIGTGSGCIAIALKKNMPKAELTALDISREALQVAGKNAELNNTNIKFIEQSILDKNIELGKFDIIVSNPPYVTENEKELMHSNVLEYEPDLALFVSNNNPLLFYQAIGEFAKKNLTGNGSVWVEINEALGEETMEVFRKNGFCKTEIIKDLNGKDRFVWASR